VQSLDAAANRVVAADASALESRGARIDGVSWISGEVPASALRASVRVRYGHAGTDAELEAVGRRQVRVRFDEPVRAVAPGQAAVFYAGDTVLGGGWIAEALA
jgi:tRNA-specific 2-thiouridylase